MTTVLLAIGDRALRQACASALKNGGHVPVTVSRPLEAISLKVDWGVSLVDGSKLGRDVASYNGDRRLSIGLGMKDGVAASLPLPLVAQELLATIERLTGAPIDGRAEAPALGLDSRRRLALFAGREVELTRTEFRLLEVLLAAQPTEVPLVEILQSVWGFTEGKATSELVRAHVRNLRLKLTRLGLTDAVRSRRGRGYALVV
jgi:hypothetical protein